jgi:large subunit ribosomal protein L21
MSETIAGASPESTPYAVIKASGRQYRVCAGDTISVEKVIGEAGAKIQIKEVLMCGGGQTLLGTPYVTGATVTLVVEEQYRGTKILVFKKKRRNNYKNTRGHRSELTRLFVSEITTPSGIFTTDKKPHVLDGAHIQKVTEKKAALKAAPTAEGAPKKAAPKAITKKKTVKKAGAKKATAKAKTKTKKS